MNFPLLLLTAVIAALSFPAFKLFGLLQNYRKARKIGDLPIVLTPVSILGPIWAFVWTFAGGIIKPILLRIPFGLGSWVKYSGYNWPWSHGYELHKKYGPVFVIVTPTEIVVPVADPDTAIDVNNRRREFIKGREYKPLAIFGPNIDVLNGDAWQRHRRFVAPPLNERNNTLVWRESLIQAEGMLSSWTSKTSSQGGVKDTLTDSMTLSMHVLQAAVFGKSYPFEGGVSKQEDGHAMSYKESLSLILENLFIAVFMKFAAVLPASLLPAHVKKIKIAIGEFRKYMFEMVQAEKKVARESRTNQQKANLLSVLVKLSEQEGDSTGKKGLTDDELYGNFFLYNLAGHETSGNTLAYAAVLMASDMHWQQWIREELDVVFEGNDNVEDWEYEKAFPRLKRCLALMYETLRLYGPVPSITKYIENSAEISIKGKKYTLPPKTWLPINHAALHTLPEYWGEDSLLWRPDRWIIRSCDGNTAIETEKLYQPPAGIFIPWTSGPRVCPGKKFAQVEFVAVIAKLFRTHRVQPVLEQGEKTEAARARVLKQAEDSIVDATLHMAEAERVTLYWQRIVSDALWGESPECEAEKGSQNEDILMPEE